MNAQITKITIQLGTREIELTTEEARSIYAQLENVFGTRMNVQVPIKDNDYLRGLIPHQLNAPNSQPFKPRPGEPWCSYGALATIR